MSALPRRRLLLSAGALLAANASLSQPARSGSTSLEQEGACGLAIGKVHKGQLIEQPEAESCRDFKGSIPVFQGASLAKPIVATLVLKRVLRGQLALDQQVSELLPDGYAHRQNLFALREEPKIDVVPPALLKKLTVRHLLSHTAGLPNWSSRTPLRIETEPGTQWRYSGEGYVILQHILQAETGKSLDELASSEIFDSLGMRHTAFKLTERIAPWLVPGRSSSGQVRQLRFPYEIAAGSLYTSASDYARFIAATLSDQDLLRLVQHAPVEVPNAQGILWGLGWGIQQTTNDRAIWHWGNNPGFRALAMADLKSQNAAVVLTASDSGMPQAKSILRRLLPGNHPALDLGLAQ